VTTGHYSSRLRFPFAKLFVQPSDLRWEYDQNITGAPEAVLGAVEQHLTTTAVCFPSSVCSPAPPVN
jgi:hypothetical protein